MTGRPGAADRGSGDQGTFRALRVRNYRLFFVGQLLNVTGTWVYATAVAWILVGPEGDATGLGVVVALQFLPLLLLGAWAGSVADRLDRRRLLAATNAVSAVIALAVALAVSAGHDSLGVLAAASLGLGVCAAFETPARQSLVGTLVGPTALSSAVGLNGAVMTSGRMVGAALAGVIIDVAGAETCLYLNAVSFLATVVAVRMMDPDRIRHAGSTGSRGRVADGVRYARSTPEVRVPLVALAVVGTLSLNAQVTSSLLARITFDAGPRLFAAFSAVTALGALGGTLLAARQADATLRAVARGSLVLGVFTLAAAVAPTAGVALAALSVGSFGSGLYVASTNARIQQVTDDAYRGRVMALYAILFLGSTPIGSAVMTVLTELFDPRVAVAVAGAAALATGVVLVARAGDRVERRLPVR